MKEYEIVIIGAGPTGLALGAELKRLGISSLILEKHAEGLNTSRAAVIHARTLEVLEPLGVNPELIKNGIALPQFNIREKNRLLASIGFKNLDTAYRFALACPQDRTEAILIKKLNELGGEVHRSCELIAIRSNDQYVEVQFTHNNEHETVQAQWVVGCDGMHSIVREQMGIAFSGGDYTMSFVLADVHMNWPFGHDDASLFFSEKGLLVVIPLPGDNRFRIVATLENAPESPSLADFQQILDERGPEDIKGCLQDIIWASRFHIQHRVVAAMWKGRVLLAGDAAHVHSPAGGQGMNTGIQDAITLAHALKESMEGHHEGLPAWQSKRLKIAHSVVKLTDIMTKIGTTSFGPLKILRNEIISLFGKLPFVRQVIAQQISELNNK